MQKRAKSLGIRAIMISFAFLFNPNINIIDFIPDIIGYIILCAALTRLADMNDTVGEALALFKRMIIVEAARILALFWMFGLSQSQRAEQNTSALLLSFVFAIIDLITLIPAYCKLFDGLTEMAYTRDNTSILGRKRQRSRKSYTEKIKSFTVFFVIFKSTMYVLPEFTVLGTQSYNDKTGLVNIYDFVGLLRSLCFVFALVVGVIWLVKILAYFSRVRKDGAFCPALLEEYNREIATKRSLFVQRSIKSSFFCIFVGALLLVDIRVDNFNLFPDLLASLAFIAAAVLIRQYVPKAKKSIPLFALYAVISAAATAVEYGFFNKYYYGAINKSEEAYNAYLVMLGVSVADVLAFLAATAGILMIFSCVINEHTGFVVLGEQSGNEERVARVHRELMKKLIFPICAALLCAASDVFYDFGARYFGFAGFVNIFFTLLFALSVLKTVFALLEEVHSRYMLD